MMVKVGVILIVAVFGLIGCDRGSTEASQESQPSIAPTKAAEPTAPTPPATSEPTEPTQEVQTPSPTERVETKVANHLPTPLDSNITTPAKARTIELDSIVRLEAPSSVNFPREKRRVIMAGQESTGFAAGNWKALDGLTPQVSIYTHNPAGDSGSDCPSLEEITGRIGESKVLTNQRLSAPWSGEGPAYGDEIDILIFQNGEQAGFYVRKRFDHGDDFTDFCAAFGGSAEPFTMSSLGTLEQAQAAAGIVLTAREEL